jgi:DNA-binding LacI/PurR family transcriptional regulator
VAKRAGVSRSAVSRTFTLGASVSEETRRRVVEAADALGYHVNQLARGLMRSESGIACLVASEMDTPYRARLVRELSHALQKAGKVCMIINTDRSDGSVDAALRQTLNYRADASILLSGLPDKAITKLCLDSGQRIVLIPACGLPAFRLCQFRRGHAQPDGARTRLRSGSGGVRT